MNFCFIISLPRSGSTMLQRVLSASEQVATASESWLLPPLLNIRYGRQPLAEFAYDHARIGIEDVISKLPEGNRTWNQAIKEFSTTILAQVKPGRTLFVEKTPRNTLFINELLNIFDDAKFIFLYRNPLAIVHSINSTWGRGHWKAHHYYIDLLHGLRKMASASRHFKDDKRIIHINYEVLIRDPVPQFKRIFDHISIPYNDKYITSMPVLSGRMGDPNQSAGPRKISTHSTEEWRGGYGNWLRRAWARWYLLKMVPNECRQIGYQPEELLASLSNKGESNPTDYLFIPAARSYHFIEHRSMLGKLDNIKLNGFSRR